MLSTSSYGMLGKYGKLGHFLPGTMTNNVYGRPTACLVATLNSMPKKK